MATYKKTQTTNICKLSKILACIILGSTLFSCGTEGTAEQTQPVIADTAPAATAVVTEEPDPLAELDFGGETINFQVPSVNFMGWGPSDYLIATPEEETGDVVRDAVFRRNNGVEELLNVQIEFSKSNDQSVPDLPKIIMSGEDRYDMVSAGLYPLASMSVEGYFLNARDGKHFDFTKNYWNSDMMTDLAFGNEDISYLLSGDMYMDMIRASYCLYFNKNLYRDYLEDPSDLYQMVLDGQWTFDAMLSCIANCYSDVNGDGTRDAGDIYGYGYVAKWGSAIPFSVCADLTWIENNADGRPVFAMNNERSVAVLEFMNDLFYHENAFDYNDVDLNNISFHNGTALFSGCQMIASFDIFRDMEDEIGLVPYPKFDENQKNYITPICDLTNVGVIPMTCTKLDIVSAVLEALCRETGSTVLPAYYETALKVKYSRDDTTSQMLDIIRSGFSTVFPLAYGNYCNNVPLYKAFTTPLQKNSSDFVSNWLKHEQSAQKKLDTLWESFSDIDTN